MKCPICGKLLAWSYHALRAHYRAAHPEHKDKYRRPISEAEFRSPKGIPTIGRPELAEHIEDLLDEERWREAMLIAGMARDTAKTEVHRRLYHGMFLFSKARVDVPDPLEGRTANVARYTSGDRPGGR